MATIGGTAGRHRETPSLDGDEFVWSAELHEVPSFTPRVVRRRRIAIALAASDAVMSLLAMFVATFVRFGNLNSAVESGSRIPGPRYFGLSFGVAAALLALMFVKRLYDADRLGWGSGEFTRIARSLAAVIVGVIFVMYVIGMPYVSREWAALVLALVVAFVVSGRALLRLAESRMLRHGGWLQRPTLIVGSNMEAAEAVRILRANPESGLVPVGCLVSARKDRLSFDDCAHLVPRLGGPCLLASVVAEYGIDTVVIIGSAFDCNVLQRMIRELRGLHVTVHISVSPDDVVAIRAGMREISGIPLMSLDGIALSPVNVSSKRIFDLTVGGLALVLGAPLSGVFALLIKATSDGPVFFEQERIGATGKPFQMYKFRSMSLDAEERQRALQAANEADGPLFKIEEDPRVTPIGAWMRRFSIDELPQLINVLKGEMSLVGPRPPLEIETRQYTEEQWRRMEVTPGMTGLWQVSGRSKLTFDEMVRLDVFYIDNWSMGMDVALLARTIPAVLSGRGAY